MSKEFWDSTIVGLWVVDVSGVLSSKNERSRNLTFEGLGLVDVPSKDGSTFISEDIVIISFFHPLL